MDWNKIKWLFYAVCLLGALFGFACTGTISLFFIYLLKGAF